MTAIEERIVELETKVAYQEDLVQELNAIVVEQQQKMAQLETSLLTLNRRVREVSDSMPSTQHQDEKPPHY